MHIVANALEDRAVWNPAIGQPLVRNGCLLSQWCFLGNVAWCLNAEGSLVSLEVKDSMLLSKAPPYDFIFRILKALLLVRLAIIPANDYALVTISNGVIMSGFKITPDVILSFDRLSVLRE